MNDLISRKALLDRFMKQYREPNRDWLTYPQIRQMVLDSPAIKAQPVNRGRWELQNYYGGIRKGMVARIICSECGYPNEKTNYCPNCGAKMDGDGNA